MKNKGLVVFMSVVVLVIIAIAVYAYVRLPADGQYPVHWSFKGEPTRYGSKLEVVMLGPVTTVLIAVMAMVLPGLDPKKENYDKFKREYNLLMQAIMVVMATVYIVSIMAAFGKNTRVEVWVPAIVGALFVVIGNYLSRVKQSWFVGIKTPWTLSNEKVWDKTHRFGGRVFVLLGLIFIANAFIGFIRSPALFMVLVLGLGLLPLAYSYIIFKRLEKR